MSVSEVSIGCAYFDDILKVQFCVYDIRDSLVFVYSIDDDERRGFYRKFYYVDALSRFSLLGKYIHKYTGLDSLDYMWKIAIE